MSICPGNPFEGSHPLQRRAAALYDATYAANVLASECGSGTVGVSFSHLRGVQIEQVSDADLMLFAESTWREVERVRQQKQATAKLIYDGRRNFERASFILWCVFGVGAVLFIWAVS